MSKRQIPLPIGTSVWIVRENITMGMHQIYPPKPYKQCIYQIVKGRVTGTIQFHSPKSETGIRVVLEKAGPNNLAHFRPGDIGKTVFADYESCVTYANKLADENDSSGGFFARLYGSTYRPWIEKECNPS